MSAGRSLADAPELSGLPPAAREKLVQCVRQSEYGLWQGEGNAYRGLNPPHALRLHFTEQGLHLALASKGEADWHLRLTLSRYGHGSALDPVPQATSEGVDASGPRIEYRRGEHKAAGGEQYSTESVHPQLTFAEWAPQDSASCSLSV